MLDEAQPRTCLKRRGRKIQHRIAAAGVALLLAEPVARVFLSSACSPHASLRLDRELRLLPACYNERRLNVFQVADASDSPQPTRYRKTD
jgi:hypothetical protein